MDTNKYTFIVIGGAYQSPQRIEYVKNNITDVFLKFYPNSEIIFLNSHYVFSVHSLQGLILSTVDHVKDKENVILVGSSSGAVVAQVISNVPTVSSKVKGLILLGYTPITKLFLPKDFRKYLKELNFCKTERVEMVRGYFDILACFHKIYHDSKRIFFEYFSRNEKCANITYLNLFCGHLGYLDKKNLQIAIQRYFFFEDKS
ncbi:MAG: hypothetical protein AAB438_00600 [Patescibacteria group bacterium]